MHTITPILDWLLATSLRASLLTVVVFLLQAALRKQLTARMRYALWLPVLVVLLMPTFPQSRWSIETIFATAPQARQISSAPIEIVSSGLPLEISPQTSAPAPFDWPRIIFISWLIGAAGMLLLSTASFIFTLRRFKNSRHPVSAELSATLAQIAREVRLQHLPRVWMASAIHSPAVTGLLHPTLLLPLHFDDVFTPAEARLVLKHELMHLKRHDLPLNAVLCVLMALHWFNPLLWLAFFKVRLDREEACDAQVLQNDSNDRRREYGHALLKVETAFCHRGLSLGFVGIFQRGNALRSRIQSITSNHQPHPIMKTFLITSMLLMTFLGITSAQPNSPDINTKLQKIIIPKVNFHEATIQESIEYLRIQSARYDDDSSIDPSNRGVNMILKTDASSNSAKITLDLQDISLSQALRYITELANLKMTVDPFAVILAPAAKKLIDATADSKSAAVISADKIILPSVEFRDATLAESIEYIRIKSRDIDPDKKGINILLKDDGGTAKISLSLKNVPVSEALRYCVELAGQKLSTDKNTFLVSPMVEK